jgi:dihydrofolate synthase/folylpolyglutamate synthase
MTIEFIENEELKILGFIQGHYGLEVFTPGLDRTKEVFAPFRERVVSMGIKVTIIAGTNGKGQTAHTLGHLLETANQPCALWTSPHILSIKERFHLWGRDVGYKELEHEVYEAHGFLQIYFPHLIISFYEFLFFVFLRLAFTSSTRGPLKHLILEVGLGGRLDAVNHFDADCACITSISRDHQAILGTRYDQILGEKLGVGRPLRPLFTQFKLEYLNQLTAKYCQEHAINWMPLAPAKTQVRNYFEENRLLANKLFSYLIGRTLDESEMKGSIPHFKGRREEMTFKGNTLIFIGAHNIDGMRRMIELYSAQNSPSVTSFPHKVLLSFSKRPFNELDVMLKMLKDFFGKESRLILSSFLHPKALELSEIEKLVQKFNKMDKGLFDFVSDWKNELQTSKNQTILVCGSYYFIGEVQRFILQST